MHLINETSEQTKPEKNMSCVMETVENTNGDGSAEKPENGTSDSSIVKDPEVVNEDYVKNVLVETDSGSVSNEVIREQESTADVVIENGIDAVIVEVAADIQPEELLNTNDVMVVIADIPAIEASSSQENDTHEPASSEDAQDHTLVMYIDESSEMSSQTNSNVDLELASSEATKDEEIGDKMEISNLSDNLEMEALDEALIVAEHKMNGDFLDEKNEGDVECDMKDNLEKCEKIVIVGDAVESAVDTCKNSEPNQSSVVDISDVSSSNTDSEFDKLIKSKDATAVTIEIDDGITKLIEIDNVVTEPIEIDGTAKPIAIDDVTTAPVEIDAITKPVEIAATTEPIVMNDVTTPPIEIDAITKPIGIDATSESIAIDDVTTTPIEIDAASKPIAIEDVTTTSIEIGDANTTHTPIEIDAASKPKPVDDLTTTPIEIDATTESIAMDDLTTKPIKIDDTNTTPIEIDAASKPIAIDDVNTTPIEIDASKKSASDSNHTGNESPSKMDVSIDDKLNLISDDEDESNKKKAVSDKKYLERGDKRVGKVATVPPLVDVSLISDDEEETTEKHTKNADTKATSADVADSKATDTTKVKEVEKLSLLSDDESEGQTAAVAKPSDKGVGVTDDDIILLDEDIKAAQKEDAVSDVQEEAKIIEEKMDDAAASTEEKCETTDAVKQIEIPKFPKKPEIPIIPLNFMKTFKSELDDMTKDDLDEYCLVKVIEAVNGSDCSDLKAHLKTMEKNMEEWKKKVVYLTKQNRDLHIVVKTISDELKRKIKVNPAPIKITRSVGLQVGLPSNGPRSQQTGTPKKLVTPGPMQPPMPPANIQNSYRQGFGPRKPTPAPLIKVASPPRAVYRSAVRSGLCAPQSSAPSPPPTSTSSPSPGGQSQSLLKTAFNTSPAPTNPNPPVRPTAEKRPLTSPSSSMASIDLTDDEPPVKAAKTQTILTPVRPATVTPQPNRMQFVVGPNKGPRQVLIPINQQNSNLIRYRKAAPVNVNRAAAGALPTLRPFNNLPGQQVRLGQAIRPKPPQYQHPAPLPHTPANKQLSHPNSKWIPPKPTLKISKVDNGIVISWEMEDFVESRHEAVASYQIYAYQETPVPPSSDLWKKIGDVAALPLPMACTLTHFNVGFKYFFAVRALDVRSRVGPFSLPGQILLL